MAAPRLPYVFKRVIRDLGDLIAEQGDTLADALIAAIQADDMDTVSRLLAEAVNTNALIGRVMTLIEANDLLGAEDVVLKAPARRQKN